MRWLWPIHLAGFDRVPAQGPAILCANHLSFFDSVFVLMTLDRRVSFIGKADYLDSWTTRRLFTAMGMIPIDRDCGPRAMVALEAAASVLRRALHQASRTQPARGAANTATTPPDPRRAPLRSDRPCTAGPRAMIANRRGVNGQP